MTNAPTLYPWQRADLDDMARKGYVGLLAYEPGAGKTVCACTAIVESGSRVTLIVAPKSTFTSAWIPTLAKFGLEGRIIGNGNKDQRKALFDFEIGTPGVYLTTNALIGRKSTDISAWSGDMLICDEVHTMITPKSSTQRRLSGYHASDGEPLAARFPRRIALSGTPLRQAVINLWGVARLLYPEYRLRGQIAHDNLYTWLSDRVEYTEIYTNQRDRDGRPKTAKKWQGEKVPGQWVNEAPSVYIHKRREPCCAWHQPKMLPSGRMHPGGFLEMEEPQEIERIVELHPAQKKAIRELENLAITYLKDNPLVAELPITTQQRVRQICLGVPEVTYYEVDGEEKSTLEWETDCVSPMLDEVFQILSELPEEEPVVIYLDSRRFAEVTTARLNAAGISAAEFSGATTKNRDQYLADFGTRYRVLVMVSSAGGVGTDGLQAVSKTEIIMETPVSLTIRTQAESRQDRLGGRGQVQRFRIKDSFGYAEGRLDSQLVMQMALNSSLRKVS